MPRRAIKERRSASPSALPCTPTCPISEPGITSNSSFSPPGAIFQSGLRCHCVIVWVSFCYSCEQRTISFLLCNRVGSRRGLVIALCVVEQFFLASFHWQAASNCLPCFNFNFGNILFFPPPSFAFDLHYVISTKHRTPCLIPAMQFFCNQLLWQFWLVSF